MTVVYLTTADSSPWTVPAGCTSAQIEVIGGGGGGSKAVAGTSNGAGGGGGGYSKKNTLALTPGNTVQFQVGTGGAASTAGGDTYFNGASLAASSCGAHGGSGASGATGGAGGSTTGAIGDTTRAGGNGGTETNSGGGGAGGGGAAGPFGAGKNGGIGDAGTNDGGAGGGAADNGTAGSDSSGTTGGNGGTAQDSTAGGTGGTGGGASPVAGGPGSHGSGGGGGGGNGGPGTNNGANGGVGGDGVAFDATHGPGGGGGAGGASNDNGNSGNGGNGGKYGGGGAGSGYSNNGTIGSAGTGADGLIVITFTAAAAAKPIPQPIVLNPGGVPMAAVPAALGKSPSYNAVSWQEWESYPWGPVVTVQLSQPFWIGRTAPRLPDEPEAYTAPSYSLHLYRTTYQTVGQPWLVRYQRPTPRLEPEDYVTKPANQAILYGRTTPAAPTGGAPWYLWQKRRPFDDADEFARRAVDHFLLLYGRPQIVLVTQPYAFGPPPPWGYVPFEPDEYPQPRQNLHAFRGQTVTVQIGQPFQLLSRRPASVPIDEFEGYQPKPINHAALVRTTPSAGAGQPWYLWRPWPLNWGYMTYVEPYDIPVFNPFMIERNVVPIIPPPDLTGSEYIVRARRRGNR